MERLEDEADLAVADLGELVLGEPRHLLIAQEVLARGRRVEAAEQVHQRRLARSRRPMIARTRSRGSRG
jgi:hypothetical protein